MTPQCMSSEVKQPVLVISTLFVQTEVQPLAASNRPDKVTMS